VKLKLIVSIFIILLWSSNAGAIEVPGELTADGEIIPITTIGFYKTNKTEVKKFGAVVTIDLKKIYKIDFEIVDSAKGLLALDIEYVDGAKLQNAIWSTRNYIYMITPFGKITYQGESFKSLSSIKLFNRVKVDPSNGKYFPQKFLYSPITGELLKEKKREK